jgi:hypothetical protein
MAATLPEAVAVSLLADASLTTAFGRAGWLWRDEAPAGEPVPVAVLAVPDRTRDTLSNRSSVVAWTLQLTVWATTRVAAATLGAAAAAVLEAATITFTDGTLLSVRRAGHDDGLDPDRGPGGIDLWRRVTLFDALTSHEA